MKVTNMTSSRGNIVANQFIITDRDNDSLSKMPRDITVFQSYESAIVKLITSNCSTKTYLDSTYWDYSVTTSKYRNQFLNETKKETQAKIDSGEYILTNLN